MKGVRSSVLCGMLAVTTLTGCDTVKQGASKIVQRFRGGDTTKTDTTARVAATAPLAADTSSRNTKAPAGRTTTGATKTPGTATKAMASTRTTPPAKTGTTAPATKTASATKAASGAAPATKTPVTVPSPARVAVTTTPAPSTTPAPARAATGPRGLTDVEQAALDDLAPQYAMEFDLHPGWFRDHPVKYYDFGPTPQPIAPGRVVWPIYGFDARGNPVAIAGQRPIFSSVPGIGGYSGFYRLWYLIVADHVTSNQLRDETSADALVRRHRAILKPANVLLNLPIVPRGSRLVGDSTPPAYGWFQGREIQYFDFGAGSIAPVPLWTFVTGTDANGDPVFLRSQSNVVDTLPARAPFADLWAIQLVHVDSAYAPNTLRSANAVVGMHMPVESAHSWRNCPIVSADDARIARAPSPLRAFADNRTPLPPSPTIVP